MLWRLLGRILGRSRGVGVVRPWSGYIIESHRGALIQTRGRDRGRVGLWGALASEGEGLTDEGGVVGDDAVHAHIEQFVGL